MGVASEGQPRDAQGPPSECRVRRTLKSRHWAQMRGLELFRAEKWEGDHSDLGSLAGTRGSWEDAILSDTKGLGITDAVGRRRDEQN